MNLNDSILCLDAQKKRIANQQKNTGVISMKTNYRNDFSISFFTCILTYTIDDIETTWKSCKEKIREKNGGERVNSQPFLFYLKIGSLDLYPVRIWHFIAHRIPNAVINKTGKMRGKSHFTGKIWGNLCCTNQPISKPGINPSSL